MPTPYTVTCSVCRGDLIIVERRLDSDGDLTVMVDPCEKCMDDQFDQGHEEGYEKGLADAE